jgi:hypothetical protein
MEFFHSLVLIINKQTNKYNQAVRFGDTIGPRPQAKNTARIYSVAPDMQSYTKVWASGIIPFMHFVSRPVLQKSNRELMSSHVRVAT